jgi:hypothetical protein
VRYNDNATRHLPRLQKPPTQAGERRRQDINFATATLGPQLPFVGEEKVPDPAARVMLRPYVRLPRPTTRLGGGRGLQDIVATPTAAAQVAGGPTAAAFVAGITLTWLLRPTSRMAGGRSRRRGSTLSVHRMSPRLLRPATGLRHGLPTVRRFFRANAIQASGMQILARQATRIRDGGAGQRNCRLVPYKALRGRLRLGVDGHHPGRPDRRIKLNGRGEGSPSFRMRAISELPELAFHPSTMLVSRWPAIAATFEPLGLFVSEGAAAGAP